MSFSKNLGEGDQLSCDVIHTQVQFLQGKVLTVIDAAFTEKEQKKAVKDLINKAFSDQLTWIRQLCYSDIQMMTSEQAENILKDSPSILACGQSKKVK